MMAVATCATSECVSFDSASSSVDTFAEDN